MNLKEMTSYPVGYPVLPVAAISDHQQNWEYEDGPWKGPGPSLLVAADFILFLQINPFMICFFKFAKKL